MKYFNHSFDFGSLLLENLCLLTIHNVYNCCLNSSTLLLIYELSDVLTLWHRASYPKLCQTKRNSHVLCWAFNYNFKRKTIEFFKSSKWLLFRNFDEISLKSVGLIRVLPNSSLIRKKIGFFTKNMQLMFKFPMIIMNGHIHNRNYCSCLSSVRIDKTFINEFSNQMGKKTIQKWQLLFYRPFNNRIFIHL